MTNKEPTDEEILGKEGNQQLETALGLLDEFQKQILQDRDDHSKNKSPDSHLPIQLQGKYGKSVDQIFQLFDSQISQSEFEPITQFLANENTSLTENLIPACSALQEIASKLTDNDRNQFCEKLNSDVNLFLSKLYRFESSRAVLHSEDDKDSAVYVTRKALNLKFENFNTDGYLSFTDNQGVAHHPVIYISQAGPASLAMEVCHKLGLPVSCVAVVPTQPLKNLQENLSSQNHEMNAAALDKMIQEDITAGKRPCIVFANCGSPALGHNDPIHLLRVVCNKYNTWLHVRGPNLATKILSSSNIPILAASKANSITLNIAEWYGLSTLPSVTLINSTYDQDRISLNKNTRMQLSIIPIWLSLVRLGYGNLSSNVILAQDLIIRFVEKFVKDENIDLSTTKVLKKAEVQVHKSFKSLVKAAEDQLTQYARAQPVMICFRLSPTEQIKQAMVIDRAEEVLEDEEEVPEREVSSPENVETETTEETESGKTTPDVEEVNGENDDESDGEKSAESADDEEEEDSEEDQVLDEFLTDLYDSLNVRLYEKIKENLPRIAVDAVQLSNRIYLRFSPINSAALKGTNLENIDSSIEYVSIENFICVI